MLRSRRVIRALLLTSLLLGAPLPAHAQFDRLEPQDPNRPAVGAVGLAFNYARPVDEFLRYVDNGYGLDGFIRFNADPQGILSLRLEGGFLIYGRETKRVPLSSTVGGRILVDLTTSNNIGWAGIGPQLTLPTRYLQPYVNAAAGFSYFFTQSSVEGSSNDNEPFASTKNYDDATWSWGAGGGFLIPFRTRTSEWAIDLGVRYHANGDVHYLRKGGIEDLPGGGIRLNPIQSDANLLTYRLGFTVTMR